MSAPKASLLVPRIAFAFTCVHTWPGTSQAHTHGRDSCATGMCFCLQITCSQKILVDKAPDHLVIQLLRFEQGSKKSTRVQCPEYLDFTKYMKGGRKVVSGRLSIDAHSMTAAGSHHSSPADSSPAYLQKLPKRGEPL